MFEPPLDLNGARILFVNADGIRATGLKALEQIAKSFSKDVWVFAAGEEQSGAGHSLSLNKPVWSAASQSIDFPSVAVRPIA